MADVRELRSSRRLRPLRVADRWFRAWGAVALGLLGVTAALRLAGAEAWTVAFVAAHLAALLALVPLGVALAGHALAEGYRRTGSGPGAALDVLRRYPLVSGLVFVALVTAFVSTWQFDEAAVRRTANFVTVSIVAVLIVRYMRASTDER